MLKTLIFRPEFISPFSKRPKKKPEILLITNFDLGQKIGKELPSKAHFNHFLQLGYPNFRLKCLKGLEVTKIVKKTKFEGFYGELEP